LTNGSTTIDIGGAAIAANLPWAASDRGGEGVSRAIANHTMADARTSSDIIAAVSGGRASVRQRPMAALSRTASRAETV
jgi:hypothetical protein